MFQAGIYCIILLFCQVKVVRTEIDLSPMTVYSLLMKRIDDVVHDTKNLKSELAETKAVVDRIEKKIERIEANVSLIEAKTDKYEENLARSLSTTKSNGISNASESLKQRNFRTQSTTLRKMLANEKSHMRNTVENLGNRLNTFETDFKNQLTRLYNTFETSFNVLNNSMVDSLMSVNNKVKSFDDRTNERLQEMNSTFEGKIIHCQTKIDQLLVTVNLTLQNEQNGVSGTESKHQSMTKRPDPCVVPHDYDSLLSITNKDFVSLYGGYVVNVTDYVYLNCSKARELIYEPSNRRFKCENGNWVEADRDKLWQFGNNGTFPKCRKAKCDPKCQNGGVCSRDNYCRCKHLTKGRLCEQVVCDDECKANGGKCIIPGKCECPVGKFGRNCQISGCKLPKQRNMAQLSAPRELFSPGETIKDLRCDFGYSLSSQNGMTCQDNGEWSDTVECVQDVLYLISTKTGSIRFADTDAKGLITLYGDGGNTNRIQFYKNFEKNSVDEIRILGKDIRPIKSVKVQHDGSGIGPDWYVEYVSIYVENMEEFYVFRNTERLWVKEDEDVILYKEGKKWCISSFGLELKWLPNWNMMDDFILGSGGSMNVRACKQACVNYDYSYCGGVYYFSYNSVGGMCIGFVETGLSYFDINRNYGRHSIYLRKCKDDV